MCRLCLPFWPIADLNCAAGAVWAAVLPGAVQAEGDRRAAVELAAAVDVAQGRPLALGRAVCEHKNDNVAMLLGNMFPPAMQMTVLWYTGGCDCRRLRVGIARRPMCCPHQFAGSLFCLHSRQARGLGKFLFFRLHGFGYDVLKQVGGGSAGCRCLQAAAVACREMAAVWVAAKACSGAAAWRSLSC